MSGQRKVTAGAYGRTERPEDPLHDQQAIQVRLAQETLGQTLEPAGDEVRQ